MPRLRSRSTGGCTVVRRAVVLALASAASTTLVACGGSDDDAATTSAPAQTRLIDNKKVSDAIVRSIREQRSLKATASCPQGIAIRPGSTFECTARYRVKGVKDRVSAVFVVTQLEDGNVRYAAK
jgi:hypothetical protein